jgi:hypothetical protein
MINDYNYCVVDISELNNVDYSQVLQTSADTVRKSLDESRFILKYEGQKPETIQNLENNEKLFAYNGNLILSHSQILEVVSTEEWTSREILIGIPE